MEMIKRGIVSITLKSDLCVSSGYSFAGIIDSDICYDEFGIPYIPGKRLRGCMREVLERELHALFPVKADVLFGKTNAAFGDEGSLIIGNAYINGYKELREDIIRRKKLHKQAENFYNPQQILTQFTHVLGQTSMEKEEGKGTAKDNSLRYTRVVNRNYPWKKNQEMVFQSEISFLEKDEEMIRSIIKGVRHIGLKRNRGLGNIICSLHVFDDDGRNKRIDGMERCIQSEESGEETRLYFNLKNTVPLMLSGRSENKSENYILGQQLLGILVGRYLSKVGHSAEDEAFQQLFLDGDTKYLNLYPSDGCRVFYPVPEYLNRLKKTKKIVFNLSGDMPDSFVPGEMEYSPENGNQPKKLKGKFVHLDCECFSPEEIAEVTKEIIYHHSLHKKNVQGEDGVLYGMEVVSAGQCFHGEIRVASKYSGLMKELLTDSDFYFGKSRSSQYGKCTLTEIETNNSFAIHKEKIYKKGTDVLVTFLSDAVFMNKEGVYTTYYDEVKQMVAQDLGIEYSDWDDKYLSFIQASTVSGYMGKWNKRKPVLPSVRAGSYLVYSLTEDYQLADDFVGEKNWEGYGQIRIDSISDLERKFYQSQYEVRKKEEQAEMDRREYGDDFKELIKENIICDWIEEICYDVLTQKRPSISNSALGRITLMLKESLYVQKQSRAALEEFTKRIESISTENVRNDAERILRDLIAEKTENVWRLNLGEREVSEKKRYVQLQELEQIGFDDEQIKGFLDEKWGTLLMTCFVQMKYEGGK